MSATSVGQIGLDLTVNQQQFNKQMTGIQSLAKKAGVALAGTFAVSKIVQFGQKCVELGSDLQEVQNVVDVTFPTMSARVNDFAKNASSSFGLSETMAKKYTGTLGSMAKAFGFSEEQAFNMGSALTGLAGDVASFYNLSQDEAYTKLKSVFTGETESLKDLGVVMTQTALDSYAMANGFGKTTSAMTEAEKVALRYAFVQDRLSAAQGDFQRTSDSWANQVKVLNLQFESLMSTLGQGLISALTPVIKVLNQVLQRVQVLAVAFKDLMEGMFGAQTEATAFNSVASAAEATADSTGATAENLKKANKYLAGFDVITKVSNSSKEDEKNTSGLNIDVPAATTNETDIGSKGMLGKFKEMEVYLKKSFSGTFQYVYKKISRDLSKIQKIFSKVFKDIKKLADPFVKYMQGPFTTYLNEVFEAIGIRCSNWLDSLGMVFQDAWDIVINPFLSRLMGEWLPGYTNFATQLVQMSTTISSEMKNIFDMLWEDSLRPFMEFAMSMFTNFMDVLDEFWNEWGDPILSSFQDAIYQTSNAIQVAWEEFFKPVFDALMEAADDIWTNHLGPLTENFMDMVGEFVEGALQIYNAFIVPLVEWIAKLLAPMFEKMAQSLSNSVKLMVDVIDGLITSFKGLIQFVAGVFTGDWKTAWEGVKNIFKGVFDSLVAVIKTPLNLIIDAINALIGGIVTGVNTAIQAINRLSFKVPDWVPGVGGSKFGFSIKELSAPKIPKLASGGFVKKNTPQLAIIGDNRHQGEVVAPEDKLKDMAMMAVRAAAGPDYSLEILKVLKEILEILKELDLNISIDGKQLKDIIVEKINQHTRQTGVCEIII